MERPYIPFSDVAMSLAAYSLWSEEALQGQGVRLQGIGYGEARRSPLFGRAMPWQQPPPQSDRIFEESSPALGAVGVTVTGLDFTIPTGYDAIFTEVAAADLELGSAYQPGGPEIVWRLFIDARPVEGFYNFATPQGSASETRRLPKMGLEALSGQRVLFQVAHIATAGLTGDIIRLALGGYQYPSQPR